MFNKPAQWPIRILWVTKQKGSQRSLKATVGGWIEIWSATDNAARPAARRAAEQGAEAGDSGFVLKAGPRANLSAEQAFPSGLLPGLEQELIVLVMVSGGTIDQR